MSQTVEEQLRARLMAEEILVLRKRGKIHVGIDPFSAFQLIACLQLAWRHPHLSDSHKATIERFGKQLQAAFADDQVPQIALTLEQGWHKEYDR